MCSHSTIRCKEVVVCGICHDNKTLRQYASESRAEFVPAPPRSVDPYEWVPRSCVLLPLGRDPVCRALAGSTIVMVGDSVLQQTFYSLVLSSGGSFVSVSSNGQIKTARIDCAPAATTVEF